MANYFRITAYSPAEDIGMIVDSNGKFEKIWQFSSCLVKKGFDILEVSKSENFTDGNIPRTQESDKILLRACQKGEPLRNGSRIEVSGQSTSQKSAVFAQF